MTTVSISVEELYDLCHKALIKHGCDEKNAAVTASSMTMAEKDGSHSHGIFRLAGYVAALKSGKINGKATPVLKELTPCILRIDGDNCMAPLAIQAAKEPLIESAKKFGLAAMSLVKIHHFSALWIEVEMLTNAGLAAIACTSYMPSVAPAGGTKPFYGTNPMAFGWPRKGKAPMIFDQATATMAKGEIMIAARDGKTLPPGVGIDNEGNSTNDPNEVLKGCILPFGGYKGANIAMMIELLAGPLIGETTSIETAKNDNRDGGPPQGGEFILAFDPEKFGSEEDPLEHGERLFSALLENEGTRLPGYRRDVNRSKNINNVTIPESLYKTASSLCE